MMGSNYMPVQMPMTMPMMKTMKRKELDVDVDEVSDDLHDFSLSSPARKIRRLNAQLPPIMEEEREQEILGAESSLSSSPPPPPPAAVNEEKAIVLYKPLLQPSSPSPTLSLSVDLNSGFKNQFLQSSHAGGHFLAEEEEELHNKNNAMVNNSLAVIPWVPCQFQLPLTSGMVVSHTEATELMEADNMGESTMDIEENNYHSIGQGNAYEFGGMRESDGFNQWQQQHCMIPQLPQSISTPITWSR